MDLFIVCVGGLFFLFIVVGELFVGIRVVVMGCICIMCGCYGLSVFYCVFDLWYWGMIVVVFIMGVVLVVIGVKWFMYVCSKFEG